MSKVALVVAVIYGVITTPALAFEASKVSEKQFLENIVNKTWTSTYNEAAIRFEPNGEMNITTNKGNFVGNWTFDSNKGFCREGEFAGKKVPLQCQAISMIGDKITVIFSKKNPKGIPYILSD